MTAPWLPAADQLEEIRHALQTPDGRMRLTYVFNQGLCVQVYRGARKVGPVLVPAEDQTLGELLATLGQLVQPLTRAERRAAHDAERRVDAEFTERENAAIDKAEFGTDVDGNP